LGSRNDQLELPHINHSRRSSGIQNNGSAFNDSDDEDEPKLDSHRHNIDDDVGNIIGYYSVMKLMDTKVRNDPKYKETKLN
jgi:hypothetical protein